ncbi:MAG TPA: D-2-hydroxyacid dehydrogenase family protein [Xanthobacteraceae bacterium]|jgi:D-3-phosphoglycerate dehydrogenase|nr:D-2-hydroxyacid dehydrogenase family protein [Xanthobacteraceae bacterium]
MSKKCAVLDDYQNLTLNSADWSKVKGDVEITVFNETLGDQAAVIRALAPFDIVCLMRERTLFPKAVIDALPNLKLIVTSGMRNAAIDISAASARNIPVCGTESLATPTTELTWGLIIELARKIGVEHARLKAGAKWQSTLGIDLAGRTLGIIGLGKLGSKVGQIGRAFGMSVIAWSQNLTAEKCKEVGATLVTKEELFKQADFITVHTQLSARTRGLVGSAEFNLMKPSAYFINTSRGPIVDEAALISALRSQQIAGAAVDVYDVEPLPLESPLRKVDNLVITPHLGYVTADNYSRFYGQMVEDIRAWLDGSPARVIPAK